MAVTNQHYIHKEMKELVKSREYLLSFSSESSISSLSIKNINAEIYKSVSLMVGVIPLDPWVSAKHTEGCVERILQQC
jgi:hypothetical protein